MRKEKQKRLLIFSVAFLIVLAVVLYQLIIWESEAIVYLMSVGLLVVIYLIGAYFILKMKTQPVSSLKHLDRVYEALGAQENITAIEHCVTRVKFSVKSSQAVADDVIRQAGIQGVIKPSNTSVHLITKEQTTLVYEELKRLIDGAN